MQYLTTIATVSNVMENLLGQCATVIYNLYVMQSLRQPCSTGTIISPSLQMRKQAWKDEVTGQDHKAGKRWSWGEMSHLVGARSWSPTSTQ